VQGAIEILHRSFQLVLSPHHHVILVHPAGEELPLRRLLVHYHVVDDVVAAGSRGPVLQNEEVFNP
jgi:hypothetical protein